MTTGPGVCALNVRTLEIPFQVFLCQCSCYIAEDQQFQWLEKVRGGNPDPLDRRVLANLRGWSQILDKNLFL